MRISPNEKNMSCSCDKIGPIFRTTAQILERVEVLESTKLKLCDLKLSYSHSLTIASAILTPSTAAEVIPPA